MAAVTAEFGLEIGRLKSGLEAARNEIKNFKSFAAQQKVGDAVFSGSGSNLGRNMQMQQTAFQLQDFIVQVQAGQGVLRAFIQQGSQMAGAFGPWGAVIGLAVAALGSLWGILANVGEESEEVKKAVDELKKSLADALTELDKLAASDAAKSLAEHKDVVDSLADSWKESLKANADYFAQLQKTAQAVQEFDTARNKLAEQRELAGAKTPEEREAIRLKYGNQQRDINAAGDQTRLLNEKSAATTAVDRARLVQEESGGTLSALDQQLFKARVERDAIQPPVLSDQRKLLNQYDEAASGLQRGYGDADMQKAVIAQIGPKLAELNEAIASGVESYTGASEDEKRLLAAYEAQKAAANETVATLQKEIAELEKIRQEAFQAEADAKKRLGDIEKETEAAKTGAEAEKLKADIEAKEKQQAKDKKLDDENARLREDTEKNALKALSPKEQAQALRERLAKSFGFEVKTGEDVQKGLSTFQRLADIRRDRGDKEGEKSALEKLKAAQTDAAQLAGLAPGAKPRSALVGEATSALNVIFGRGGTADIQAEEAKKTNGLLQDIQRTLTSIKQAGEDDFGNF